MKATELRIGNLLQRLDGSVFNVTIHDLHIIHLWDSSEKLLPNPIPLTEDWLLKFGFEKRGENGKNHWYSIQYDSGEELSELGFNVKSRRIYIDSEDQAGGYSNAVEHVHQLQNLYFALTGEELKII